MNKSKLAISDVTHVAKLANLPLSQEELTLFQSQLSETLSYVEDLEELDTKGIIPTPQVTGKTNELREDQIKPGLTKQQALQNATETHNGFFKVPKVVWS